MISFSEAVLALKGWQKNVFSHHTSLQPPREWCLLDAPGLTQAELRDHFDATQVDDELVALHRAGSQAATAYKLAEMDYLHGLHKSMVARHKGRLMYYRDDCASKHYHTGKAISLGVGKFYAQKAQTERA